jgi:hypothetical protein
VRNDESVKTVISGHVSVSPVASAKSGVAETTENGTATKGGGVRVLLFYEVSFDLLEDYSGWINLSYLRWKFTRPMLQKKRDPITRWKSLQPPNACSQGLEIVCFVTPAGAVSQNRKDDHSHDCKEYHDNQYFYGGEQKAPQRDDRTKQG